MCTLAIWLRPGADVPLVVFANRDERLDRPSLPPRVEAGRPRVLAPVDVQEGGTWLGLNEHGVFVGITNRAGAPRDPSRRSRGALVRDALAASSARDARARLEALVHGTHNPFHLLYADRDEAFLTWDDEHAVRHLQVGGGAAAGAAGLAARDGGSSPGGAHPRAAALPGVRHGQLAGARHAVVADAPMADGLVVVTEQGHAWDAERPLGARDAFVRRSWQALAPEHRGDLGALLGLLAQHGPSPLEGACVHADAVGYGTRSSFALALASEPGRTRGAWIEGKPCTATPVELAAELAALGV